MKSSTCFLAAKISLLALSSVARAQISPQIQKTDIKPFEAIVVNGAYSLITHRIVIDVTEADLKVYVRFGLPQEKDSLLYSKSLPPSDTLFRLSKVDFDQLKNGYLNPCVPDGSQIIATIARGGKWKSVYLGNYYQPDIGIFLSLVNMLVPEKYRVAYDKAKLEAEDCTGYEKGTAIQLFDSVSGNVLRLDSTHTTVSAIDKNGMILWKAELDSKLWGNDDIVWPLGKNDSTMRKQNTVKTYTRPAISYFVLVKGDEKYWCRSPDGSPTLWVGFGFSAVGLDVRTGKTLCWGRD